MLTLALSSTGTDVYFWFFPYLYICSSSWISFQPCVCVTFMSRTLVLISKRLETPFIKAVGALRSMFVFLSSPSKMNATWVWVPSWNCIWGKLQNWEIARCIRCRAVAEIFRLIILSHIFCVVRLDKLHWSKHCLWWVRRRYCINGHDVFEFFNRYRISIPLSFHLLTRSSLWRSVGTQPKDQGK
mgnify:FL=1